MRRVTPLALAFLAASPSLATEPAMPSHIVAETFCLARLVGNMSLVENEFSAALYTAIGQAMLKNAEEQKAHPEDKPPFGDGIPYASFMDAPSECTVDYEGARSHPEEIAITYAFTDAPDAGWTDTLILSQNEKGAWELDDIAFYDGSRLTATLSAAFAP